MDILDIKILSRLLNDCRESDRQIGKSVGISGGAVNSRIRKMQNVGIIENFTLKIEPPVLGYGIVYIVVTGEDIDEIIEQVKFVGEPFFVVPCIGGITVCSIVVKENLQEKIELAKNLMKDVRVLSIFEAEAPEYNSNLTKTDLQIIEKLIINPREKIDELAKETGLSTKTITRSIEKMQKNEGIQFTLVYDPKKIDNFIPHAILTWIEEDLKETLKELEEKFSDVFLQTPFIAKNQIVLFLYSDNIFKIDEITQKILDIKAVKSADLFIPKKISFMTKWIEEVINLAKESPTLHLVQNRT